MKIRAVTFDCADPYAITQFWSEVTGFSEDPANRNYPDDPEGLLIAPDGSLRIRFERVPEGKTVKNRVHLDLAPDVSTPAERDAEIDRVIGLGAKLVADFRQPDAPGQPGWAVLADPEGNEFCVELGGQLG